MLASAILLAGGGILSWWRRRPRDPEEIERRRRIYLNQVGRIVEGEIVEITEAAPQAAPARRGIFARGNGSRASRAYDSVAHAGSARPLVVYCYEISGVTYETAQDVSGMEERACLKTLVAGQPASVKYDPANPSNSILIADDWSGLH